MVSGFSAGVDWRKWLFTKLLSPKDSEVCEALDELAKMGDPDALDQVRRLLESHPSPEVRWRAAWALGTMGVNDAVKYLRAALQGDSHPGVAFYAAKALGRIRSYAAARALLDGLGHVNWRVRARCLDSLKEQGELPEEFFEPVVDALADGWVQNRRACVELLGSAKDPRAVAPLCRALLDPHLQHAASVALSKLGKLVVPKLVKILRDESLDDDVEVKVWVVRTLGMIGHEACLAPLREALRHRHWRVRRFAARALGNCRQEFGKVALQAITDRAEKETDPHVREELEKAADRLGKREGGDRLGT
ncbi:MAG: hypothetical protein Kow0069_04470 [Promethearchaeota archaeon]